MIIYLVGFMGSGKTTFGRRMASRAGWIFEDLDSLVEDLEGRSVEKIFKESGENYFREVESKALRSIPGEKNLVIACGGGTPCFMDNMDYMNQSGITVYLKHSPATIAQRLAIAKKIRPLIQGMNKWEMERYIKEKLAEREEWYNKAKLIVDGLKADPGKLMEIVLSKPPNDD